MTTVLEPLARVLFGPAGRGRARVVVAFLGLVVFVVFAFVQHAEVLLDLIPLAESNRLSLFTVAGGALVFGLLRSGLDRHVGSPSTVDLLALLHAMVSVAWAYAITGPARGAVMSIMLLILVFGMFSLSLPQIRTVTLAGFGLLGGVMLWKVWTRAEAYDPRVEAVHLVFAVIVMGGSALLAQRIARMRHRLQRQKAELAEALEQIRALATRDSLTGLLNRRAMQEQLQSQVQSHARRGTPMTLVLFDLDHFKRINDTLGHRRGDQVLQMFAEVAQQALRGGDMLSRWGGEEFLALLPDTLPEQARQSVERIRQALATQPLVGLPSDGRVTFSAGLAQCRGPADIEQAIERADLAMYAAKAAGRDRTLRADESMVEAA